MKKTYFTSQTGHASLEACLIFPVLICFCGFIFLGITVFSLRMKINAIAEDMATCHFGRKTTWQCQTQAKFNCLKLLEQGGLTNASIQTWYLPPHAYIQIQAKWAQYHLQWNFKQQSPLAAELFK